MLKTFKSDLLKYKRYSGRSNIILLLTQQGLWAIFIYRFNNSVFRSNFPRYIKVIFLVIGLFFQKLIEILTGISLPYSATIGKQFYIGHFGGIIINSKAVIGENCNISQGVTIGVSGTGNNRGVPKLGDNIYVGVNAVIAGDIKIGNNVVIGANSLVIKSIESNVTVLGVPAKKVSDNNSEQYI